MIVIKRKFIIVMILTTVAAAVFSSGLLAQKPSARTFFNLGVMNSEKAEYSEAIDYFQHAIKLKPDYAEAYLNLGHSYYSTLRLQRPFRKPLILILPMKRHTFHSVLFHPC
jgi:tetratricopeptide (TPR) repeat protein